MATLPNNTGHPTFLLGPLKCRIIKKKNINSDIAVNVRKDIFILLYMKLMLEYKLKSSLSVIHGCGQPRPRHE